MYNSRPLQVASLSLLSLACLVSHTSSLAVEESSTGAIITFPDASKSSGLSNKTWEVYPAAFGFADYGGTLEAYLALPKNKSYHTECVAESGDNQYSHYILDFMGADTNWILVIDRGDCFFAKKVYYAQQMGAEGVIVIDNVEEALFPMWKPDTFDENINIPSVEMSYDHGKILMDGLGVQNWDPLDMSNTVYPTPVSGGFNLVKAVIEWGLPHEDDNVEWEMWTSSNDDRTIAFKHNFKATSAILDEGGFTNFTPNYYILNGSHWGCDSESLPCDNQCINSGRYCAVDPENDLEYGVSGRDVVKENLRQLCVWNFTTHGEKTVHNESVWWDYVNLWNDKCFNGTESAETFHTDCSVTQLQTVEAKGAVGLLQYVENCVNATGGYGENDKVNTFLDNQVKVRESLSVYVMPAFRVNEFMIFGEVDCDQVTESTCSVFDAICSGFIDGTEPEICHRVPVMPSTTPAGCDSDHSEYELNVCNVCMDPSDDDFDTAGMGCDGVCDSGKSYDDCGICRATSDTEWNACYGCDGVKNSGKETNPCGYCISNKTSNFDDYGKDCSGTCQGYKQTDQCDKCLKTSDPEWNSCLTQSPVATVAGGVVVEKTTSSGGTSTAALVIGVIAFIVIVAAGVVIYKLYHKQQHQSRQFENIIKTYTLMDESPGQQQGAGGKNPFKNKAKRDRMKVPTDDVDDMESPNAGNVEDETDGKAVV